MHFYLAGTNPTTSTSTFVLSKLDSYQNLIEHHRHWKVQSCSKTRWGRKWEKQEAETSSHVCMLDGGDHMQRTDRGNYQITAGSSLCCRHDSKAAQHPWLIEKVLATDEAFQNLQTSRWVHYKLSRSPLFSFSSRVLHNWLSPSTFSSSSSLLGFFLSRSPVIQFMLADPFLCIYFLLSCTLIFFFQIFPVQTMWFICWGSQSNTVWCNFLLFFSIYSPNR